MASNKNQHFVPRCYLRAFTIGGKNAAINLFNIDRARGIPTAPVKNQCSSDYFYGKDSALDEGLKGYEDAYGPIIREILAPNYSLNDEHRDFLRQFCYLQYCRTEAASRRAAESWNDMGDFLAMGGNSPGWKSTVREAVVLGLRNFVASRHFMDSLKVCLVRNQTKIQFITSDDPAVLTNRWYIQKGVGKLLGHGIINAGALFIFPLSPEVLCLIYDGGVYSLPNQGGWISTARDEDIEALNEHQFLNCFANVYFRDWGCLSDVERGCQRAKPNRPVSRHEMIAAVLNRRENGVELYRQVALEEAARTEGLSIVQLKAVSIRPTRWPPLLKWRQGAKVVETGDGRGVLRRGLPPGISDL